MEKVFVWPPDSLLPTVTLAQSHMAVSSGFSLLIRRHSTLEGLFLEVEKQSPHGFVHSHPTESKQPIPLSGACLTQLIG